MKIDAGLIQFATVRQLEYIEAIEKCDSMSEAGRVLGVNPSSVTRSIAYLHKHAARQGYSPEHHLTRTIAPGLKLRGTSQLFKAGQAAPVMEWVKTTADEEAHREFVKGAIAAFIDEVQPIAAPEGPRDYSTDVIPWVQIGDAHIGMLAHAAEVGENFDLKIAENELCGAIAMLIDEMPACERMVINDLGDGTHYDNMEAVTAASGHPLDADGRFPKMIRVYSRVMRFIVERALTKAKFVDVIINQGNHSRVNDFWMPEVLHAAYDHTGRVHILDNTSVFIPYRMGKTLVMIHHSDKCKPQHLVGVMTSDFRKDFGETEFHYIDIGHVHHHFVSKEHPSVVIESWNHLAASDKWAHDSGYRARKAISVVLRSKTYGEIGRRLLPIQEIRDRLSKTGTSARPEKAVYTV